MARRALRFDLPGVRTGRPEGGHPGLEGRLSRRGHRARAAGGRLMPAVGHHSEQGAAGTGAALPAHARQRLLARGRAVAAMRRCRRCSTASTRSSRAQDRYLQAQLARNQRGADPRPRRVSGREARRGAAPGRHAHACSRRPASCSRPARGRGTWRPSRSITSTSSTATRS